MQQKDNFVETCKEKIKKHGSEPADKHDACCQLVRQFVDMNAEMMFCIADHLTPAERGLYYRPKIVFLKQNCSLLPDPSSQTMV